MATHTYKVGNQETTTRVTGFSVWMKESSLRTYYAMTSSGKASKALEKLYKVRKGTTRDETVEVEGVVFAYSGGVDAMNSKIKRASLKAAAYALATQIMEDKDLDDEKAVAEILSK